jgi:hypothetical protein
MVIECVPVPRETGDMAPIYFKVKTEFAFLFILFDTVYIVSVLAFHWNNVPGAFCRQGEILYPKREEALFSG